MTYDSAQGNFLHLSLRVSVRPCGATGGQIRAKVGHQEVRVGPYRIRMGPWQVRLGPGDHSRAPGDQSGSWRVRVVIFQFLYFHFFSD